MKTFRGFGRLLRELPQPARAGLWVGYGTFPVAFLLAIASFQPRIVLVGATVAGAGFAVAGWCVFRNIRDSATTWSTIYRETKGIPPEGFTMGDVPSVKALGFFYLLIGTFWMVGGVFAMFE